MKMGVYCVHRLEEVCVSCIKRQKGAKMHIHGRDCWVHIHERVVRGG